MKWWDSFCRWVCVRILGAGGPQGQGDFTDSDPWDYPDNGNLPQSDAGFLAPNPTKVEQR